MTGYISFMSVTLIFRYFHIILYILELNLFNAKNLQRLFYFIIIIIICCQREERKQIKFLKKQTVVL